MHSAWDHVEHGHWLEELEAVTEELELSADAKAVAKELFLTEVPDKDRSKRAMLAASVYAGSLIAGDGRTQGAVAAAASVSRLSIQKRWKPLLETAGLEPPQW